MILPDSQEKVCRKAGVNFNRHPSHHEPYRNSTRELLWNWKA